ncbi:hypothetical protein [Paraburkholderia sp.]|uniref:hypothetical protein n=1 Tax=Paraburkholderia sp. TaxID=1926495 RepID=UPI0039E4B1DD
MSVIFARRPFDSRMSKAFSTREAKTRRAVFERRHLARQRLDIVALAGSAAAIAAIALGAPVAGLAIWVATLAPLVFES